jgi:serralysin
MMAFYLPGGEGGARVGGWGEQRQPRFLHDKPWSVAMSNVRGQANHALERDRSYAPPQDTGGGGGGGQDWYVPVDPMLILGAPLGPAGGETSSLGGPTAELFDPAAPDDHVDEVYDPGPVTPGGDSGSGGTAVAVAASGDARIDGMLTGTRWSNASITYTDPDAAGDYQAGYTLDRNANGTSAQNEGFARISANQLLAVHQALNQAIYTQPNGAGGLSVEGFTNLGIDYGTPGAGTGTLRIANTSDNATGFGFFPANTIYGGDAWMGTAIQNPTQGNYEYNNTIHELGHILGLKHAHEGGGPGATAVPANMDSLEFTVMTYRSFIGAPLTGYSNEAFGYPQTYMMLDILALQYMYGADFTVNGTDTVYTFSPTTGDMFINGNQATNPGANRIFNTIWDGNGNDTYDLSNYTTNMRIDLRPGESSTFSTAQLADLDTGSALTSRVARGNLFNALQFGGDARSLIENAIGGSGNDDITGNAASNTLRGNGGADILNGLGGNDFLLGGAGADQLNGGADFDYAAYGLAPSAVLVDLLAPVNNAGIDAAGDTHTSIEGLIGSAFNDGLAGTDGQNGIFGGGGNDTIYGRGGPDSLYGEAGDDLLYGGVGGDLLDGGDGFDFVSYNLATAAVAVDLIAPGTNAGAEAAGDSHVGIEGLIGSEFSDGLLGTDGVNSIYGAAGDDSIWGRDGGDFLFGNLGQDVLYGGLGGDHLDGGDGFDFVSYALATGGVAVDLLVAATNAGAEAAGDSHFNLEGLIGSDFNDGLLGTDGANSIYGGAGNDYIWGRGGDDALLGTGGDDTLDGQGGNDTLIGDVGTGLDHDTFVFAAGFGVDSIYGFGYNDGSNHDVILFHVSEFASFAEVMASAVQLGTAVRIQRAGDADAVVLEGCVLAGLTPDDFGFFA